MIDNILNFNHILMRCSFDDENGDVRTVQGYVMVENGTLGISQGALAKNDFSLQGNGKLDVFDGLVPCPTVINSITVFGQEDADGIVHVSYTYTGEAYQVKYRVDNTGDYVYALADLSIDIPGLSIASHTIEIIPVCVNGYEGTGLTQDFVVTKGNSCGGVVTGYVIHTSDSTKYNTLSGGVTVVQDASSDYITPTITGTYDAFIYSFDSDTGFSLPAGSSIPIASLSPGLHSLNISPVCYISGGGFVQGDVFTSFFNLTAQSLQSKINYSYVNFPPNNSLNIYVNGILTVSLTNANGSNFITVATGATVKAVLQSSHQPLGSRSATLTVTDNTTGVQLYNQSGSSPITKQFTFTANGDEFTINGVVSA